MSRTYAIINYYSEERDIFKNILDKLQRNSDNTYYVFYKKMPTVDISRYTDIKFVKIDSSMQLYKFFFIMSGILAVLFFISIPHTSSKLFGISTITLANLLNSSCLDNLNHVPQIIKRLFL